MTKVTPKMAVMVKIIVGWKMHVFIVIPPLYRTFLHKLFGMFLLVLYLYHTKGVWLRQRHDYSLFRSKNDFKSYDTYFLKKH